MADFDAHRAAAFALGQPARVAVVPVLLGERGAGNCEGANLASEKGALPRIDMLSGTLGSGDIHLTLLVRSGGVLA